MIHKLPRDVCDKLRLQALKRRRSVEAEGRTLLAAGVGERIESEPTRLSSLGMMRGEIRILGDWKEMDREIEEMFEESINKSFDQS